MDDLLPVDVMARLTSDFGDRADAVAALLLAARRAGGMRCMDDRVVRCIVWAARGHESKVQRLIELARRDYRDVIIAGEYDDMMRRTRDLSVSFLIDSPETFWASEVARMMASRGYRLTALESRPATLGPFTFTSDAGEGQATFIGQKGEIAIEKRDRQWSIHGNDRDLEILEFHHAFSDARAFLDAVSGYLLSKISEEQDKEPNEVSRTGLIY
jgi:hypothetical protein